MATAIRRVYENVQTTRTVIRDFNRFRQIITVLTRHGLGWVVERMNLQDSWIRGLGREKSVEAETVPLERRVLHAIQELGPTFVKFGQILSTRPDLIPPSFVEELKTLQDRVPPFGFEAVRQQTEANVEASLEEVFDDFSEAPLASASIAQVHRARLKSGEEVVVKIQRPGIRSQIEADVEILTFLAKQLEANFPETKLFSPLGIVKEFEKAILKEIDFRTELDHIERFRRNFSEIEGIHFPVPYKDLSTREILVMEFIDGIKITETHTDPRFDQERIVKLGFKVVFKMIFEDGFFHADLHPGNLLVRVQSDGANELCLIDCGLVGVLTPKQKDYLVRMLIDVVRQDFRGIARLFWEIAIHDKPPEYFDVFEADVMLLLQKYFAGANISEIEFGALFKDLIDGAMRHEIIMPADYTMTFKAVMTMEGIAKQIAPDVNLIEEAQPYVTKLLVDRYNPRRLLSEFVDGVRTYGKALIYLPDRLNRALIDLREGRAHLEIELAETRRALRDYTKAQNRNQLAIVEGALLIAGTMALQYPDPQLFGLPGTTVVFYGLAAVLGVGHLLGGLRSGGI